MSDVKVISIYDGASAATEHEQALFDDILRTTLGIIRDKSLPWPQDGILAIILVQDDLSMTMFSHAKRRQLMQVLRKLRMDKKARDAVFVPAADIERRYFIVALRNGRYATCVGSILTRPLSPGGDA